MLSLTGYAADAGADEDSWALLGQAEAAPLLLTNDKPAPPLSARSKQRVAASTPATAPVGGLDDAALLAMSPADMAGLMVRLSAHMSGAGSSSNGTVCCVLDLWAVASRLRSRSGARRAAPQISDTLDELPSWR